MVGAQQVQYNLPQARMNLREVGITSVRGGALRLG
jgi:hypothetical protein